MGPSASDGASGYELWRSDGSAEGTVLVKDIAAGSASSYPHELRVVAGRLLFGACDDAGCELWTSDGTEAGTRRVADLRPGPLSSNPRGFTRQGSLVLFTALDDDAGWELWALPVSALDEPLPVPALPVSGGVALALGLLASGVARLRRRSLTRQDDVRSPSRPTAL